MQKKHYLLILFIIAFGALSNAITSSFLTKDVIFILVALWSIWGWFYYQDNKENILDQPKNRSIAWIIFFSMIFSMFIPWIFYNQNIIDTFFSQRFNYAILVLLVLLRIQPTGKDFIYAIKISAYISIIGFIISLIFPQFFLTEEVIKEIIRNRLKYKSTDIGFAGPGYTLVPFYLYYLINRLVHKADIHDIIECSVFMLYIIAVQNRSTIIGTLPFYCYGILCMKSTRKGTYLGIAFMLIIILLPFLDTIYNSLMEETQRQLEDKNYNRWQALSLYLIEMKKDFITILFGNGVWSKSGSYLSQMTITQETRGTYISDIGWLGTYFYYGIIPVGILIWFALKAIFTKYVPAYLKYFSIWLLFVPTIHPYLMLNTGGTIEFAMFFYLIMYYTSRRWKLSYLLALMISKKRISYGYFNYHSKL